MIIAEFRFGLRNDQPVRDWRIWLAAYTAKVRASMKYVLLRNSIIIRECV